MGCPDCKKENEEINQIAYYRWKNATIGFIGCKKHLIEIISYLNKSLNED